MTIQKCKFKKCSILENHNEINIHFDLQFHKKNYYLYTKIICNKKWIDSQKYEYLKSLGVIYPYVIFKFIVQFSKDCEYKCHVFVTHLTLANRMDLSTQNGANGQNWISERYMIWPSTL